MVFRNILPFHTYPYEQDLSLMNAHQYTNHLLLQHHQSVLDSNNLLLLKYIFPRFYKTLLLQVQRLHGLKMHVQMLKKSNKPLNHFSSLCNSL